jgi:RHS repeat-associated protein
VVTNQTGVRVFAAAYDPYGGIQKIWENSYSPELKFSGKERDSESNLDYFGARYYANYYYRWLSPDPVVNRDESMRNPQLWNLYSFCRNNPATYWDPDGAIVRTFTQEGYEAIQRTMGDAYLAQNIFWDKSTGLIDINREIETENLNYLRLWYLVASPQEIIVSIADRVLFVNKSNEIKASSILFLKNLGAKGIFLPPRNAANEDPLVNYYDSIVCAVLPSNDKSEIGRTLAHELYGHAFLYIRGLPYRHEKGKAGGLDPNGFVNKYILRIENRGY